VLLKVVMEREVADNFTKLPMFSRFHFLLKVDSINGDTPLMLVSYFMECGD